MQCNLRIAREASQDDYHLNLKVLEGYLQQLQTVSVAGGMGVAGGTGSDPFSLSAVLGLPGVVDESGAGQYNLDVIWPLLESVTGSALKELAEMRSVEGQAMARDLRANCQEIRERLVEIQGLAPEVVLAYQQRLTEKLQALLADHNVSVSPADVVREIGIYADRVDISEEIVRLASHLDQFLQTLEQGNAAGRKLEFLIQEMFRETNTIGSKANNAEIAQHVVEIKTAVERIREMVQNVE